MLSLLETVWIAMYSYQLLPRGTPTKHCFVAYISRGGRQCFSCKVGREIGSAWPTVLSTVYTYTCVSVYGQLKMWFHNHAFHRSTCTAFNLTVLKWSGDETSISVIVCIIRYTCVHTCMYLICTYSSTCVYTG